MKPDVAVVGAGVIGLSVAWRAAHRHGLSVALIDDTPGTGASHVAAGMLAAVTEVHYGEEPLLALTTASAALWPGFAAELEEASGSEVGYRHDGTLAVALNDDDQRFLNDLYQFQRSLGLSVERLRGSECRAIEPMLSPRVRGGILVSGDHQVDNRRLVAALITACERAGVKHLKDRALALGPGPAVKLSGGDSIDAGRVVLAAGCWSGALAGVPVRPVKGQILRLAFDPASPPLRLNVRGFAAGRSFYIVPRAHGELVAGTTVEERGYDTTVTAGAVRDMLQGAIEVLPGLAELHLTEPLAGLRPGTPDNALIIGPLPGDPNLLVATGHYRNGILLSPVTADAIGAVLAGDELPVIARAFGVERFAS